MKKSYNIILSTFPTAERSNGALQIDLLRICFFPTQVANEVEEAFLQSQRRLERTGGSWDS